MRMKAAAELPAELNELIDINCEADLPPERQAAVRKQLRLQLGPLADPMLRLAARAAGAERRAAAIEMEMERFRNGPRLRGIVTDIQNGCVRVALGAAERVFTRPPALALDVGQTVLVDAEGRAVLDAGDFLVGGQSFVFCDWLDGRYALVRPLRDTASDTARQLALVSAQVDRGRLAAGDHVLGWLVDAGNIVLVTSRLGPARPAVRDEAGAMRAVKRDEIVGLDEIIEEGELLFLVPSNPAFARRLAVASPALRGHVYAGVSGNGKTTLSLYFLECVRGAGGKALFRTAPEYLSKWVGDGPALLRADVAALDMAFKETGVRSLLVIDELEAIALDRTRVAHHAGFVDVLDELLGLLSRTEVRMIGISNLAKRLLDPALTRDGRLRIVQFPSALGAEAVAALVARVLADIAIADGDAHIAGERISDLIFAPSGPLAELLRVQLGDGRMLTFGAPHLTTGATIADGIVRPTIARAARRDQRGGLAEPAPLAVEELLSATRRYFATRACVITRESITSILADELPEDQTVVRVERIARPDLD